MTIESGANLSGNTAFYLTPSFDALAQVVIWQAQNADKQNITVA